MEKINVDQVFERFYKADEARSKTSSGLGLSIAKELVLRMEGKISARIEGNDFCVEIVFPEKKESSWTRRIYYLTNYFQYVIFISSKKGSS